MLMATMVAWSAQIIVVATTAEYRHREAEPLGGKQDQTLLEVCQCLTYEKWYAHSSLIIECLEFMGKDMVTAYLIIFDHI